MSNKENISPRYSVYTILASIDKMLPINSLTKYHQTPNENLNILICLQVQVAGLIQTEETVTTSKDRGQIIMEETLVDQDKGGQEQEVEEGDSGLELQQVSWSCCVDMKRA